MTAALLAVEHAAVRRPRLALRRSRAARARHPITSDFYALTGEVVETLRSLSGLAGLLVGQIAAYGRGRVLRDDDPATTRPSGWPSHRRGPPSCSTTSTTPSAPPTSSGTRSPTSRWRTPHDQP